MNPVNLYYYYNIADTAALPHFLMTADRLPQNNEYIFFKFNYLNNYIVSAHFFCFKIFRNIQSSYCNWASNEFIIFNKNIEGRLMDFSFLP